MRDVAVLLLDVLIWRHARHVLVVDCQDSGFRFCVCVCVCVCVRVCVSSPRQGLDSLPRTRAAKGASFSDRLWERYCLRILVYLVMYDSG